MRLSSTTFTCNAMLISYVPHRKLPDACFAYHKFSWYVGSAEFCIFISFFPSLFLSVFVLFLLTFVLHFTLLLYSGQIGTHVLETKQKMRIMKSACWFMMIILSDCIFCRARASLLLKIRTDFPVTLCCKQVVVNFLFITKDPRSRTWIMGSVIADHLRNYENSPAHALGNVL